MKIFCLLIPQRFNISFPNIRSLWNDRRASNKFRCENESNATTTTRCIEVCLLIYQYYDSINLFNNKNSFDFIFLSVRMQHN